MLAVRKRSGAHRWFLLLAGVLFASPCAVGAVDLLDAYRQALENDATFLAAKASAAAASEALPQARAGLLPSLSFNASRSTNNSDITQNNFFGEKQTTNVGYIAEGQNLTLRQPLYRRANMAQYRQAEAQVALAEQTLEFERQNLALRVAAAYFAVLAAQDQLRFAAEQKKTYYEQWQRASVMLEKGAGTRTDRDEAKARYDGVLAQEIDAANAVDLAERTLASMTGHPVPASALASLDAGRLSLAPPKPASFDEWVSLGLTRNPELASMRYGIEAYVEEVDKQRSGHLPTLDLIAQRSYNSSESVSTIGSAYNTRMIGLQLAIPLFSGGAVLSAERQARAGLERSKQQYEAGKRQMTLNLRREYNNVLLGISKVQALEEALKSARLALASTEMGVKAGTRNNLDVLNARQQIYSVQRDLDKARYDYVVGGIRLEAAAGGMNEDVIETVNRWLRLGGTERASISVPAGSAGGSEPAAAPQAAARAAAALAVAKPLPAIERKSEHKSERKSKGNDLVER